jgi:hypothetical protein
MKRFAAPLALLLGSVLVSLVIGESVLRAVGFSFPSFWLPDPLTGSRLRPGVEGWNRIEGEAYVKVNSRGLRDREHALPKPGGTYRIAVLGDSYAEALQVRLEETFWWLLARRLEACGFQPGKRIEAVNFGVSGYGTAQQLLTLRHRAADYSPDLVLLAFFPGNDVRNNSKTLERENKRPFFVLRDGKLALDDSFATEPLFLEAMQAGAQRAALHDLRLYQLLRKVRGGRLELRHNAPIAVALADDSKRLPSLAEPGLDENVLREPVDAAWRDAWAVTEGLLLAMQQETGRSGARFVVAVLSSAGAVYPDPSMRRRYAEFLGVGDLFYPDRRLRGFGERHRVEVVALTEDMQRHADATGAYLHGFANARLGFGHWNQAGHALGAELIARQLCAQPRDPQ